MFKDKNLAKNLEILRKITKNKLNSVEFVGLVFPSLHKLSVLKGPGLLAPGAFFICSSFDGRSWFFKYGR